MRTTPLTRALACATAAAALLSAPAFAQDALVVNQAVAPSSLDPSWACGASEISFVKNFYATLVQYGTTEGPEGTMITDYGVIEPYLADSWEISDDGLVYTFTIADGYTFPSGNPVDAEAVRYSLQRVMDMNGCGAFFLTDGFISPPIIETIEAPDASTVVITLNAPNGNMLVDLATHAGSILDPSVVEANGGVTPGQPNEFLSSNVTESGPFLLQDYQPNQSATLVANPGFGGEPAASERIQVNWITSAPTLLLQARTGQADVTMGLSKQAAASLEENEGTNVVVYETPFSQQFFMPNSKEPWSDVRVREAAALAVPYDDILERVAYGYGNLFYGQLNPAIPGFNEELSQPLEMDIERAQELMAETGLELPVPVEVVIQEGDSTQQQLATILQSTWQQIGLDLTIRIAPAAEYQELSQSHQAQSLMRLDGPGVIAAGYYWGYDAICDISFNLTEFCDPAVDELIFEYRAINDEERRQEIADEITVLWRDQYPKIQFFQDMTAVVLNDSITSFTYASTPDFADWAK